jgi:hypothetical protein
MPVDPPWNPAHIKELPSAIKQQISRLCGSTPAAQHYFALYRKDQITMHYELLSCERPLIQLCHGSKCLHQVFREVGGSYRLIHSFYGASND